MRFGSHTTHTDRLITGLEADKSYTGHSTCASTGFVLIWMAGNCPVLTGRWAAGLIYAAYICASITSTSREDLSYLNVNSHKFCSQQQSASAYQVYVQRLCLQLSAKDAGSYPHAHTTCEDPAEKGVRIDGYALISQPYMLSGQGRYTTCQYTISQIKLSQHLWWCHWVLPFMISASRCGPALQTAHV